MPIHILTVKVTCTYSSVSVSVQRLMSIGFQSGSRHILEVIIGNKIAIIRIAAAKERVMRDFCNPYTDSNKFCFKRSPVRGIRQCFITTRARID